MWAYLPKGRALVRLFFMWRGDGRAPRGLRACFRLLVSVKNVLFGRRPCGRLLPTASRRSAAAKLRCLGGLICPKVERWCAYFLCGGEMVALPGGSVLAVGYWFRLRMCFLGDAHAGVSCRLQVGAPPRPSFAAWVGLFAQRSSAGALIFLWRGDGRAPRGLRACCRLLVSVKNVLFGRRPCGRLLPSTTRRSAAAELRCLGGLICPKAAHLRHFLHGGRDATLLGSIKTRL